MRAPAAARALLVVALFAAMTGAAVVEAAPRSRDTVFAPLVAPEPDAATVIPGQYMVVLHDDIEPEHMAVHFNWLATVLAMRANVHGTDALNKIKHVYNPEHRRAPRGYAGRFDPHVLSAIRKSPLVAYVEPDQVVRTLYPPSVAGGNDNSTHHYTQKNAPWGLSRISHRARPDPAHYKEYPHAADAGEGVTAYVVDTGVFVDHVEFEGRAEWGATIPDDASDTDGNGHGTHCAGTIAGKTYGVSKNAKIVAVKVLGDNGSGSMSDVVKGVEFTVTHHHQRAKKAKNGKKPKSVANMSLGGGKSRMLDRAVDAAVDAGVHFAVAAGNDARNACNYSPAASANAVTVGASAIDDKLAYFSNYGKCVDVIAPGKDILSTWIGSKTATNIISGTSMASPHTAGLLAYLLSQNPDKDFTGQELKDLVIELSTKNAIKGLPQPSKKKPEQPKWPFPWPPPYGGDDDEAGVTPNRLIFTGGVESAPEEPLPEEPTPEQPGDDDDDEDDDDEDGFRVVRILEWFRKGQHHGRRAHASRRHRLE
ncbi:serine protease [Allomyces javanicus]|nr:serine protease [Allomyces javanicus]